MIMNEYFISGEVANENQTFSMVAKAKSASEAFSMAIKLISEKTNAKSDDIHIKTQNKC